MFNALSGYAYFWLIEPDIKFCCDTAETFFEDFETQEADFLAPKFGRALVDVTFLFHCKSFRFATDVLSFWDNAHEPDGNS